VNTEWGNFNLLPVNKYDRELDRNSTNPATQQLEKMISGMYLGELTRMVIKDLIRQKIILKEHGSRFRKGVLNTKDMAAFERDRTSELSRISEYMESLGITNSTLQDRRFIRQACRFVSRRAARISGAAISAVVTWMDTGLAKSHTVAIDGTLYTKFPKFKRNIDQTLQELHGEKSEMIQLATVSDGSGLGAAIASAVAGKSK